MILNSYHRGYKWTDDQNAGIQAALKGVVKESHIYVEYMDASRMNHGDLLRDRYFSYKSKYRGMEFAVICVTDSDALSFMLSYGDMLFPGTPVVHSGISAINEGVLKNALNFKGMSAKPDLKANIDLILSLHPRTQRVVFINEWTANGQVLHEDLLKIIPLFEKTLEFQLLENVDTKEVFRVLTKLPPDSAVLYGVFSRDKVGRTFDHREIIYLFSRNSKAPIYSPWDFNLGCGIVGGVMSTGFSQGEMAGKQALQLLRGARVENMRTITRPRRQYMFDYNQLKRFNIYRDQLPAESLVVNYPETLYGKYRRLINGVIAVIVILLIVISVLLWNIRFRRRAEKDLIASRERLRALGRRLAEIEDEARKNLSRELHDEIGQNMTVLGVNLNILRSQMTRGAPELVESRIVDSLSIVKQTTQRIRHLMSNLRSPVLDDYGLVAALQLYAKQWADRTGIAVQVRGPKTRPQLDPHSESALFRIVQESLTNVLKHARATEVIITVCLANGKLHLSVEDNGIGLDEARYEEPGGERGWGLITMSERALTAGGALRVRSFPGLGTHIIVEVPA